LNFRFASATGTGWTGHVRINNFLSSLATPLEVSKKRMKKNLINPAKE
jgi:hypothetical protein